jgi:hypothetical protein
VKPQPMDSSTRTGTGVVRNLSIDGSPNVDTKMEAATDEMSTARQRSGRPPRSEIPYSISHTGHATRKRLCGSADSDFLTTVRGTSLVGARSTFDMRRLCSVIHRISRLQCNAELLRPTSSPSINGSSFTSLTSLFLYTARFRVRPRRRGACHCPYSLARLSR